MSLLLYSPPRDLCIYWMKIQIQFGPYLLKTIMIHLSTSSFWDKMQVVIYGCISGKKFRSHGNRCGKLLKINVKPMQPAENTTSINSIHLAQANLSASVYLIPVHIWSKLSECLLLYPQGCRATSLDHRFLLYEYVSNSSLDKYIENSKLRMQLTWEKRAEICLSVDTIIRTPIPGNLVTWNVKMLPWIKI